MIQIKNRTLEFNADVFIIPNHCGTMKDYFLLNDGKKAYCRKISEMNGLGMLQDSDHLIQTWFVSEDDLDTDNLAAHGAVVLDENGQEVYIRPIVDLMPEGLFDGCKEGDTIVIRVPYDLNRFNNNRSRNSGVPDDPNYPEKDEIELIMNVTLAQTKYRYARFGNFEECLEYVRS